MTLRAGTRSLVFASAIALAAHVAAQQPAIPVSVQNAPLTQVIPVDPLITTGTLSNGLRYYVRANAQPQGRAELRLVVNAGSVLEDDDQRGLAHFVEHMAFNGTQRFPGDSVATFMQSLGMRFGAHVNANTSFDETVYELQIPTDSPAIIDRAFTILEDWAHRVSFTPDEVDKERGVILEEWRLGLGAEERIQDKQFPLLLKGSRYADRLPIGRPEIIQNVNHDRLRQFYSDWYRPDLMAVIIVGDFDRAAIEAQIKTHFSSIPALASQKPRPVYDVPDQPGTLYSVLTDPEATATSIGVYTKTSARDQSTVGVYRQQMTERLFAGMLSARLDEIAQKPNAPFLGAGTGRGLFVRTEEATTLSALVPEGGVERGLEALFTEVERVARFGFTETELNRQRLNQRRFLQQAAIEKDKSPSGPLADEFVRNFTQGEPIPGIVYEFGMNERFLPEITVAEVNGLAKRWAPDSNRTITVTAPERSRATLPDETKLAAVISAVAASPLSAYVDSVSSETLLDRPPAPGSITGTSQKEEFGITEWRLSNGVRVVLKPTTFKQDEIVFRATSPGGTSLASDADYMAAATAAQVIAQGGLGKLSRLDLDKVLAGTNVFVRADIGDTEEGLSGGAARNDLETMFQLIYLTFTAPRPDPVAFGVMTAQLKVMLANQAGLPETAFRDALNAALTQNHLRARPMTPALVGEMNLEKSLAFYKDRFADASDFTFVFVGSFDLPTIRPLVERYLGSLPALNRKEAIKDVGPHPPVSVVQQQVTAGVEPRSQVSIVFSGTFRNDEQQRVIMRAMAETLSGNLHRTLREDLGGTYGVSVEPRFTQEPTEEYRIGIDFGCDPARMESLVTTVFQVIDQFKLNGPSPAQVADARSAFARDLETNSQSNGYLLNRLVSKYANDEDVAEVFTMQPFYDQLTPAAIRDAARAYLDTTRYVKVTQVPQKQP